MMRVKPLLFVLAVVVALTSPPAVQAQSVYAMTGASFADAASAPNINDTQPVAELGARFWISDYLQTQAGFAYQGPFAVSVGLQLRPFQRNVGSLEPYLGVGFQRYFDGSGAGSPERAVFPVSLGTYYHLNQRLSVQAELTGRWTLLREYGGLMETGSLHTIFGVMPSLGVTYRGLFNFGGGSRGSETPLYPSFNPDIFISPAGEAPSELGEREGPVPMLTQPLPVEPLPTDGEMVLLPDGLFIMGLTDADPFGLSGNAGLMRITISQFYMDRYEVTNREYLDWIQGLSPDSAATMTPDSTAFARAGQRLDWTNYFRSERYADHPVVAVTHEQAQAFCEAHSSRLPTEAEWEYGARGGELGNIYPWQGLEARDFSGQYLANFNPGGRSYAADGFAFTAPVGSFPPNSWGLYDMSGNVAEWVADTWHPTYSALSEFNPLYVDESVSEAVVRGGSWESDEFYIGIGVRDAQIKQEASVFVGFRCARDVGAGEVGSRPRNPAPQRAEPPAPVQDQQPAPQGEEGQLPLEEDGR